MPRPHGFHTSLFNDTAYMSPKQIEERLARRAHMEQRLERFDMTSASTRVRMVNIRVGLQRMAQLDRQAQMHAYPLVVSLPKLTWWRRLYNRVFKIDQIPTMPIAQASKSK